MEGLLGPLAAAGPPESLNVVILLHVSAALAAGLLLGYERTFKGHAAGMRTYAIVCMGSAALASSFNFGGDPGQAELIHAGASRVVQGIITGIGFLGAGVIMREGFRLRGLSTAASIWMAASIGILIGLGFYLAAGGGVILVMLTLELIGRLERRLPHYEQTKANLDFAYGAAPDLDRLSNATRSRGYDIVEWSFTSDRDRQVSSFELVLQTDRRAAREDLLHCLGDLPDIRAIALAPIRD